MDAGDAALPARRGGTALPWLVLLGTAVVYGYLSLRLTGDLLRPTTLNYYSYLVAAFVEGRVDVMPPSTYDLSWYHGKWYLYWGPAPVLVLWPFYLVWGVHASDVLYTLLGGLANVVLIHFCIRALSHYFRISLSPGAESFLLLSFAFASPNFYLALTGQIWSTSQIIATTFLLSFYLFFFRYLTSGRLGHMVTSLVFLGLACWTRYSLIFQGVLLAYPLWEAQRTRKISLRLVAWMGGTVLFFVCIGAVYNYLRFQNPLEIGVRFQQGHPRFDAIVKSGEILSVHHLWHNLYYYFLHPVYFSVSQRALKIDVEGNSVLMVYPSVLVLAALPFKIKQFGIQQRAFVWTAAVAAGSTVIFLMLYFATGWVQFGSRYFLDAFPLMLFLQALVIQSIPRSALLVVLSWGMVINVWGVLTFYGK